jgi:hypothetical protein
LNAIGGGHDLDRLPPRQRRLCAHAWGYQRSYPGRSHPRSFNMPRHESTLGGRS